MQTWQKLNVQYLPPIRHALDMAHLDSPYGKVSLSKEYNFISFGWGVVHLLSVCITHHHDHYLEHAQLDGQMIEHYQFSQIQKLMQHNSQISSPDTRSGVRTPKSKSESQTNTLYPHQRFVTSEVGLQAVYIRLVLGCMLVLVIRSYTTNMSNLSKWPASLCPWKICKSTIVMYLHISH